MSNFLEKRLVREKAAREEAERILEEKSLELYLKNLELEKLNKELNSNLNSTVDQLDDLEKEHLQLFENSVVGVVISKQNKIQEVNQTFANLLGLRQLISFDACKVLPKSFGACIRELSAFSFRIIAWCVGMNFCLCVCRNQFQRMAGMSTIFLVIFTFWVRHIPGQTL
jgi:hypothetical protein